MTELYVRVLGESTSTWVAFVEMYPEPEVRVRLRGRRTYVCDDCGHQKFPRCGHALAAAAAVDLDPFRDNTL